MAPLPARVYGADQVDVAYEPWIAREETALRVGPGSSAAVVVADDGRECVMRAGDSPGRQSTRNPRCLRRPPLRAAVDGYVWGYLLRRGYPAKSGWARAAFLRRDSDYRLICGPAGADFDRRRPDDCEGRCDGRPLSGVDRVAGGRVVSAREAYLRLNPRGAAFRYLVPGDEVRRLARWEDFTAVEVLDGRWTTTGARGWVLSSALTT